MAGVNTLRGFLERLQLQQVVAPIEQVFFGRRHVRGALVLRAAPTKLFGALVDVAEQVVELGVVVGGNHPLDLRPRFREFAQFEQRERQVVAAVVVGRDRWCRRAFRCGRAARSWRLLHQERCELILCVEAIRIPPTASDQAPLERRRPCGGFFDAVAGGADGFGGAGGGCEAAPAARTVSASANPIRNQ